MANEQAVTLDDQFAEMEAEVAAQLQAEVEQEGQEQVEEEQTSTEDSPSEEEQTPQEEETESDDVEADDSDEADDSSDVSDRTQKRIRELAGHKKELAEQNSTLKQELQKLQEELEKTKKRAEVIEPIKDAFSGEESEQEKSPRLPWHQSMLSKQDVEMTVEQKLAKERAKENVAKDIVYSESTYPELNPDSELYDAEITKDIFEEFKSRFATGNTNIRLKELVDRRMKPIYRAREQALKEVKVKQQEANQAPPVNVSPPKKDRSIEDQLSAVTSIEELEKLERKIGVSDR